MNGRETAAGAGPPALYLDSSDYSNLAAAADPAFRDAARWKDARARLLALREAGGAVVRFSYPLVMEAYPTEERHRPLAVRRARAMSDMCGRACMRDLHGLFLEEAKALVLTGEPCRRSAGWRDDGVWHPDPGDFVTGFARDFARLNAEAVHGALKEAVPLNRKARRGLARGLLTAEGTLSPAAAALLPPDWRRSSSEEVAAKLLLPPRAVEEEIPARVLLGELPPAALAACVREAIRDPPLLFSRTDLGAHEGPLFGWLRKLGRAITEPAEEFRDRSLRFMEDFGIERARELAAASRREERWLAEWAPDMQRRVLLALWEAEGAALGRAGVTRRAWEERAIGSAAGTLPALNTLAEVFRLHMLAMLHPSPHPRRPQRSDAADLVHMAYMPYVDVIRCDGRAATIAAPVAERLGVRIARSVEQALDFAEAMHARRA